MSSLQVAFVSGVLLWLSGFYFGAGWGYRRRQSDEERERDERVCTGQATQGEYAEWLLLHETERSR